MHITFPEAGLTAIQAAQREIAALGARMHTEAADRVQARLDNPKNEHVAPAIRGEWRRTVAWNREKARRCAEWLGEKADRRAA